MFLLPFQVEFRLLRVPIVTLLVALLCAAVFVAQRKSERRWQEAVQFSCRHADESLNWLLAQRAGLSVNAQCQALGTVLVAAGNADAQLDELAARYAQEPYASRLGGAAGIREVLAGYWSTLSALGGAPPLTARLAYPPRSFNPLRMLSAAVAHASWPHLLGNLFFFYLFGATLEAALGVRRYLALLLVLAIGTHLVYSLASFSGPPRPTLGLSGVVYGVLALFAYCLPDARIRSVWIVLLRVSITSVSAWFVALWYVGGDALALLLGGAGGPVNLVAHVSGAAIAWLLGRTWLREQRDWLRLEAAPYLRSDH